ncbi:hypothetical protein ACT6NV_09580 [Robiginitalea sp. IMCC44478]|uniref:hypothetical protein n=1 Tax=Robiginitalea sp. IMCC44478 TaxID=3459122 RepID=UPI004041FAB6
MNSLSTFGRMQWFRLFFRLYIKASIHAALALTALIAVTEMVFRIPVAPAYYTLVFFGGIAGYNAIKYGVEPWKYRWDFRGGHALLLIFSLCCLGVALIQLCYLPLDTIILLGCCVIFVFLYGIPVLPGVRNLRSFGILKVIWVSLVWTLVSVSIPLWETAVFGQWNFWLETLQRFLWIIILMLPFEIRDMNLDPLSLQTIPQRIGQRNTLLLGYFLTLCFYGLGFLKENPESLDSYGKTIALVLLLGGLWGSSLPQKRYYASFGIESIPILVFLSMYLIEYLS